MYLIINDIFNIYFLDPGLRSPMALAKQRQMSALRPGTCANHLSTLKAFVKFLTTYRIDFMSPTDESVCAYLENCLRTVKSPSTVRNYVSSLASAYRRMGLDAEVFNTYKVRTALMSIDKNVRHMSSPSLAVTPAILRKVIAVISKLREGTSICAILVLMFHTFCRISNFCAPSVLEFDSTRQFTRDDIRIGPDHVALFHKWSKSHQKSSHRAWITVPRVEYSKLCPHKWVCEMLRAVPTRCHHQPLLCFNDYNHMPATYLQRIWNSVMSVINVPNYQAYTLHGLRRGGASHVFDCDSGAREDIKAHGLWRSDTVDKYLPARAKKVFQIMKDSL